MTDRSLIARLREGSEAAAETLFAKYAPRLRQLAAARCGADLKARVDADDIVQSAFASFFRGARDGQYDAPTGEEIWNLLVVISVNKVRAKGEYHRAAKRDIRKTSGDEAMCDHVPVDDHVAATILKLTVEEVIQSLPESARPIVTLRLDGMEVTEIAKNVGRAKRSVERILQDFRESMAKTLMETPSAAG
jgi:RNA polymerase sigma-70 factor, ECF subfamily